MTKLLLLSLLAALAALASGCTGGSGDGTLAPGQIDADGPNAVPPPTDPGQPIGVSRPPPPPADQGPFPGCPSLRESSSDQIADVAAVRAQLVGMYRSCASGSTGIELRLDPDSDTRLLWWALDSRFVRLSSGAATSGTIDIGECDGASCAVVWHSDGLSSQISPDRTLRVWSDPIAVVVQTDTGDGASWSEWLRVAD